MASVKQCRIAVRRLVELLDGIDADARAKHVPRRSVSCRVKDLDIAFTAVLDEDGAHDLGELSPADQSPAADVRITVSSDDLVALANGDDDFVNAWLRGRLQVSAPVRDILRLRSLLGL